MTMDIAVIAAAVLGFLFPAYLIDAIREPDGEKAKNARGKACAAFGFLVLILAILIRS